MRQIQHGSVDQSVIVRIVDSLDGTPEEAVEHNSTGIAFWYRREGGLKTAITLAALSALDNAHADGGIEHIDDGYYRLDVPDAAVAAGSTDVLVGGTVLNMVVIAAYVNLVPWNPQSATNLGLTNLDAAVTTRATPAQVNTEVAAQLNTAVPGSPAADSINERLKTLDDNYTAARAAKLDKIEAQILADTTIASVTSQTVFTLTAGPSNNSALFNQAMLLRDVSAANNPSVRKCVAYVGSTRTVTLDSAPDFTIAAGDLVIGFASSPGASASETADEVLDYLATQKVTLNRAAGEVTYYKPDGTTPRGTRRITDVDANTQGFVPV